MLLLALACGFSQAFAVTQPTDLAHQCDAAKDPSRIAVAGGSVTEILFLLGEQERIVAVDRTSNFPTQAQELPIIGYVRNLSAEGVLSLSPTLVLGEDDMGPLEVLAQIASTGIETRQVPETHSAQGIVDKVICVASILGYSDEALQQQKKRFELVLATLAQVANADESKPRVAIIMALRDGVPVAAGAKTSADGVIRMAGGSNVFADFNGWKPVSLEIMAAANPAFIIMPSRGVSMSGGKEEVLAHPSIRVTPAGASGRLLALDGMTLLGFGPRTLDAALGLAEEFQTLSDQRQ